MTRLTYDAYDVWRVRHIKRMIYWALSLPTKNVLGPIVPYSKCIGAYRWVAGRLGSWATGWLGGTGILASVPESLIAFIPDSFSISLFIKSQIWFTYSPHITYLSHDWSDHDRWLNHIIISTITQNCSNKAPLPLQEMIQYWIMTALYCAISP